MFSKSLYTYYNHFSDTSYLFTLFKDKNSKEEHNFLIQKLKEEITCDKDFLNFILNFELDSQARQKILKEEKLNTFVSWLNSAYGKHSIALEENRTNKTLFEWLFLDKELATKNNLNLKIISYSSFKKIKILENVFLHKTSSSFYSRTRNEKIYICFPSYIDTLIGEPGSGGFSKVLKKLATLFEKELTKTFG